MKQWKDKVNKQGFDLLDIYLLDYYGVLVFLQVCKLDTDRIAVYEIATKKKKIDGFERIVITKEIKQSEHPLLMDRSENTYLKSNYWIKPIEMNGEMCLPIEVEYNSPLYLEAVKAGADYPVFGTAYAFKTFNRWDIKKYYWEIKERTFSA